ncbi:hypothetical protein [Pontibacter lucknowensis]|uniref:Uncharacterized protein n=1 Tax=Pontibacter lucknowensis TaxID=1077936 RepID=A0A1N6X2G5_9BACT|nr:hypothetical protein [Pontibacter lucknowensis]SIQ96542.1 hypothetical protein SAMN05421545_1888 [Pontibacter lucknowensis]
MKRLVLALALAGFVGAGVATPALACEGGKCKMEHSDKNGKTKKAKKGEKAEACHMTTAASADAKEGKATAAAPMSCCAKKDAPKAEAAKETKEQR